MPWINLVVGILGLLIVLIHTIPLPLRTINLVLGLLNLGYFIKYLLQ